MERPTLYLFVGYPGAGKTTVAKVIEKSTGAVHIWADQERQVMFGSPTHSADESQRLYKYLNAETSQLLAAGKSVVFDTNFNFRRDRDHLRQLAVQHDAQTKLIWLITDKSLAKQRATAANGSQATRVLGSMADDAFERIASHLEPPAEDEHPIRLNGVNLSETIIKQALDL